MDDHGLDISDLLKNKYNLSGLMCISELPYMQQAIFISFSYYGENAIYKKNNRRKALLPICWVLVLFDIFVLARHMDDQGCHVPLSPKF